MAVGRIKSQQWSRVSIDEIPVELALQALSFAHKRHTVRNSKDCTHLVLAVAITSCWTTSHLVDCLGVIALLANGLYDMKEGDCCGRGC